jgi:hypothetical protein
MLIGFLSLELIDDMALSNCEILCIVGAGTEPAEFDIGLSNSLVALPHLEGLCGPLILLDILVQL